MVGGAQGARPEPGPGGGDSPKSLNATVRSMTPKNVERDLWTSPEAVQSRSGRMFSWEKAMKTAPQGQH